MDRRHFLQNLGTYAAYAVPAMAVMFGPATDANAAQVATTHLTVSCLAKVTFNGDVGLASTVVITNPDGTVFWATVLSPEAPQQVLSSDISVGHVTLRGGATVTMQIGQGVTITFTGSIVESGFETNIQRMGIGDFGKP